MGQVLEALHRLQEVERQLAEMRRDRDAKVRRVEFHKRRVREADEKIQKFETTARQRQLRLDALQLDVNSREESITKHRQALNKAKTNKEYAAILTAMNTEKADNSKFETEILQLMEEVQGLTDQVGEIRNAKARLAEDASHAEAALAEYDAERSESLEALQAKRDECSTGLEARVLSTFNRVADHHDGEAMVPVIKLHPKRDEYACSGCNLKIALEVVNTLQTRDEIQLCKVCGRILFLETATAHGSRA